MVAGFGGNWAGDKLMGGRGDGPTPAAQAFSNGKELKLGVLLLNLGGPERQEDVEPFLYNLFADPDIIRLPKLVSFMQGPIAKVLSMRRYGRLPWSAFSVQVHGREVRDNVPTVSSLEFACKS